MPDVFQFIDDIGPDRQAMVVRRLEDRAQMPRFAEIRENYFSKIGLPLAGRILELGCGTGAVAVRSPHDRDLLGLWSDRTSQLN